MAEPFSGKVTSNALVFTINDIPRTIEFKSGGELAQILTATAHTGGQTSYSGLYDPIEVAGTATLDISMLRYLNQCFIDQLNLASTSSAIHVARVLMDGKLVLYKSFFATVKVSKISTIVVAEHGGGTTGADLSVSFSLNDYKVEQTDIEEVTNG